MLTVALHLKLLRWEDRLWLAVEAMLPRDTFAAALSLTDALDPAGLQYVSLRDWHDSYQTDPEKIQFMGSLAQFVLPDDASIELNLQGFLVGVGSKWISTGRQLRRVLDGKKLAEDNAGDARPLKGLGGNQPPFCAYYNEQLRKSASKVKKPDDLRPIAASLWFGRDMIANSSAIDLAEPPAAASNGLSTVMNFAQGSPVKTSTQCLNGLLLGLPVTFDQTQPMPEKVPCRLVDSSGQVVFAVDLSIEGAATPPLSAVHAMAVTPYPELAFEQVNWIDRISDVELTDPYREVTVNRSWVDYQHTMSLFGNEHYFRTTAGNALRTAALYPDLNGSVPEADSDLEFSYTLGTLVDGSLEPLSSSLAQSVLWRFRASADSFEVLADLSNSPDLEPFYYVYADTRLTAKYEDGSSESVGRLNIARRGLMQLVAPSEWVFLVELSGTYDPAMKKAIEFSLFIPAAIYSGGLGSGNRSFEFSMNYYQQMRWNAVRLQSKDPKAANLSLFRLALRSQVTFTPTNSTDTLDIRFEAVSANPLLDLSGQILSGDYNDWLRRDARSFAGLEIQSSPSYGHWIFDRVYPQTDGGSSPPGTRTYRCRFIADWKDTNIHPRLAAARARVAMAGSFINIKGTLRDMYGRSRPLGLTSDGSAATTSIPLRIGVFPPPLASLVVRDSTLFPFSGAPILISGDLQFLFTISLNPVVASQNRLFSVHLFFNQQLFHEILDHERVGQVWDSIADALAAIAIRLHFFELDLDNRYLSTGYLTLGSTTQSIDVTASVKAVLDPLLMSGTAGTVSVEIPLPQKFIGRHGDTSSYFACAMEITRNPALLAVNDISDIRPALVLHDNNDQITLIDDTYLHNAFATYQTSVATAYGPIAIGSSTGDGTLTWDNNDPKQVCPGLKVPPRSLWPIPLPSDNVDTTRIVGFVCAAKLLKTGGTERTLFLNLAHTIDVIRQGNLPTFVANPKLLSTLWSYINDSLLRQGPPETQYGYEITAEGGSWTMLLDMLARRFDVLHGDLGSISADPDQALPDRIPRTKDGCLLANSTLPIGYVIREALVRHWRKDASSAWNQSALWVSSLSNNAGLSADAATSHFKEIQQQLVDPGSGYSLTQTISLGERRPPISAEVLDRRKFPEYVSFARSDAWPLQTTSALPIPLRVSSFRVPTGDVGGSLQTPSPVCELPLPSTEVLAPPVVENLGIESGLLQDSVAFANAVRSVIAKKAPIRKSSLHDGLLDTDVSGSTPEDILLPTGFASLDITESSDFTTYRAFLVAIQGNSRTAHPFARDRITIYLEDKLSEVKTVAHSDNPWSELANIDAAAVTTFVNRTLAQYSPNESGMGQALYDISKVVLGLYASIGQLTVAQISEANTLGTITLTDSADGLDPAVTSFAAASDGGIISHISVVALRRPSQSTSTATEAWLLITVGFPITASASIGLTHDRDGLWLTSGSQLIDPKYMQAQSVPLTRLLRPKPKQIDAAFPVVPKFQNGAQLWKVVDTLLRQSADASVQRLADILSLESVTTDTTAGFSHLYVRLSLSVAIPRRKPRVDPQAGVVLQPVDWNREHPQRWAYGFTFQLIKDFLIQPFAFNNLPSSMRLQGLLTLLSDDVECPLLTINGLQFEVLP